MFKPLDTRLHFVLLAALCLALQMPARADETGDKLRDLARLPGITSTFTFQYNLVSGYNLDIESDVPKDTPASLRKTLRGDAGDAPIYYQMGNLYAGDGKPIDALAAYMKSAAFYREQVKAAPHDGTAQSHLVFALFQARRRPECDKVLADAMAHAPNDAQVWDARARLAFADANALLSEEAENMSEADAPLRLAAILKKPRPKEKLEAALRLMEAAKADYDRAVTVAPDDWHGYSNRWLLRLDYQMGSALLREALEGKIVSDTKQTEILTMYASRLVGDEGIGDMLAAARVSREQPLALGMAAYFLMYKEGLRKPDVFQGLTGGAMKALPEADQKTERELLGRMETLTHSADHALARQSALALGINQTVLLSPAEGRATLRRAQALAPDDPQVVECLTYSYVLEKKYADAQSLLGDALQRRESARWRLLKAKAEWKLRRWNDAEQDVSIALKDQPGSLDINLSQCAVLLHKATDAAGLRACGEQLDRTRPLMGTTYTADQRFSFNYLDALYYALSGDAEQARTYLKDMQGDEEQSADIKAVLALLP